MIHRKLYLFGPPRLEPTDFAATVRGRKVWALGAYLALTRRSHSRDHLATLFWPDFDQSGARANLRRELSKLNKLLGTQLLRSEQETVEVVASVDLWIDVAQFQRCLAGCAGHAGRAESGCPACVALLEQAVSLYQADFLSGFSLPDSPAFDEWQFFQSENLRQSLSTTLEQLVVAVTDPGKALPYAQRWVALDPLQESAHQAVMRLLAQQGQQSAALRQYERCVEVLEQEMGLAPSATTQALYTAIRQGEFRSSEAVPRSNLVATPPPALNQRRRPAHNLPAQRTTFIGRAAELRQLIDLLAQPETRLITLLGPGGIGKTRLALEAGQRQAGFADGVWFIPLAGIDPRSFSAGLNPLVTTLAEVLGFTLRGDGSPEQQMITHLHDQQSLLIFDNLEHLLTRSDFIADLVVNAPQIKVLITSQERLNLQNEWLFAVPGLATIAAANAPYHSVTERDIFVPDAAQLFAQRAQQVQPTFELNREIEWVGHICRLVEGMPLAIELAATWVRHMSPQRIAQEIEADIDFLASNLRDVPARHRSLRAVFDHAWRLLSPQEQEQLCRLAVFRGGFQRAEAQAVAGTTLLDLTTLVDKSFLQHSATERYGWHERLRHYALDKLRQDPEADEQIHRRHCLTYLKRLVAVQEDLTTLLANEIIPILSVEIDNIRSALAWAIEHHEWDEINATLEALYQFYRHIGNLSEEQEFYTKLVTTLKQLLAGAAGEPQPDTTSLQLLLGRALSRLGYIQYWLGLDEACSQNLEEALTYLRSLGSLAARDLAECLLCAAATKNRTIAAYQREAYKLEGLKLFQQLGDTAGQAYAYWWLSAGAFGFGDYEQSEHYARETLRLAETMDVSLILASTNMLFGRIAQERGQYQTAEEWYRKSLHYADLGFSGYIFKDLGNIARLQGQYEQAKGYFQQSFDQAKIAGEYHILTEAILGFGYLAESQGDYYQAQQHYQAARQRDRDVRSLSVSARNGLGRIALAQGDIATAKAHFTETSGMLLAMKTAPEALDALAGLAAVQAQSGALAQALEFLTLVLTHPATSQETKDRVAGLQAELVAELPPAVVEAVLARGQARDLWATMAELRNGSM